MNPAGHGDNLKTRLNRDRLSNQPKYCDVILNYIGRSYKLHKCLLGCESTFLAVWLYDEQFERQGPGDEESYDFRGPFGGSEKRSWLGRRHDWQPDTEADRQHLQDVFASVISWMYGAWDGLSAENICDVYTFANYMMIEDLQEKCKTLLMRGSEEGTSTRLVTKDNCVVFFYFGQTYGMEELCRKSASVCLFNIEHVQNTISFLALTSDEFSPFLEEIFQSCAMSGDVETKRFGAIESWRAHRPKERRSDAIQMICTVKMSLLPEIVIHERILENVELNSSVEILMAISKVLVYRNEELKKQNDEISKVGGPLALSNGFGKIWLFGGGDKPQYYAELNLYNRSFKGYKKFPLRINDKMENDGGKKEAPMSVISRKIGGSIYVVAGGRVQEIGFPICSSPVTVCGTRRERSGFAGDAVDGVLYIVGGDSSGEKQPGTSVEYFDAAHKRISRICYGVIPYRVKYHSVVAVHGCLFVMGGENDHGDILASLFVFNPIKLTVSSLADMLFKRRHFAAVVVNDVIMVMGGEGYDGKALSSVEFYRIATNKWSTVARMSFARIGCCACVLEGKVYVIGGYGNRKVSVNSIEMYDPVHDTWKLVYNMRMRRYMASCVAW